MSIESSNAGELPYVVVPQGVHLLELLSHNPRNVVGIIDHRANGVLQKAGANRFCDDIVIVGQEQPWPLISVFKNKKYYNNLAKILDQYLEKHSNCKFIVTSNYIPFTRFIIDYVGPSRVELWEDGLNHYLKLESLSFKYLFKEIVKFSAGFYSKGVFDNDYRRSQLSIYDRFKYQNLSYPVTQLTEGEDYYIGQPLIEDQLISESKYKTKLQEFFKGQNINYLPHPREKNRKWLSEIFNVIETDKPAETFLKKHGAGAVYSAFSTVNVNIQCKKNVFLAKYFELDKVANSLQGLSFDVELI